MKLSNLLFIIPLLYFGCQSTGHQITEELYQQEIEQWHKERIESLKGENGFLNIVGLQGLKVGANSFGSLPENEVSFTLSDFPERLGIFTLENDDVYFEALEEDILFKEEPFTGKVKVLEKGNSESAYFKSGNYFWNVIKRHSFYGIRIRENDSKQVNDFPGIERYPVDLVWRLKAKFQVYQPAKKVSIPNIFGESNLQDSPGYVEFMVGEKKYSLDVLEGDSEKYFIIFSDLTSGIETYGGGRYLYVNKPDQTGDLIIDFNQSYNPPCVYTPFATCPLTPKQNVLEIEIKAGEISPAK